MAHTTATQSASTGTQTTKKAGVPTVWTDQDLHDRFSPIFTLIAESAVQRELDRELPHEHVRLLKDAGFGALRVPLDLGGFGISLPQLFRLLTALAAADSNLAQLWRGHFAYVENRLLDQDKARKERWLGEVASGAMVGNASSELSGASLQDISTTLSEQEGVLLVNGTKYYSTGSIFADWISGSARWGEERVNFAVRTNAAGVERRDDWDGFGQRMTGSGTTIFKDAEVDLDDIRNFAAGSPSHVTAFFQLILVASLAGVAQAVVRDTVAFVQPRRRTYINASSSVPRDDPQVQQVVGEISSLAFSSDAMVQAAAGKLQDAFEALDAGTIPAAELAVAVGSADIAVYQAQVVVIEQVLRACTLMFEVGGASAVSAGRALDRHWRNARTIASHNPAIYKARNVGEFELTGVLPAAKKLETTVTGANA